MKNSPLTAILLSVLLVVSLWSVILCWTYVSKSRDLRKLQGEVAGINYRQNAINMLVNDTVEYSKKNPNPAMDQILEAAGVTKPVKPVANGTNKPATTK